MEKLPANRYPTTQVLIDDLMEFLSARVGINHNGRLVMYLRDVGVITEHEANELLQAGTTRNLRGAQRDSQLVRSALFVFSVLAAAVVVTGGAIQAADGRFNDDQEEYSRHQDGWLPNRVGFLEVIVDPWAEVFVDGESVMTTPHAQALPLPPGKHYLRLENPYYLQETREVIIRPGQRMELKVEMTPKHEPAEPQPNATKDKGERGKRKGARAVKGKGA